MGGGRKTETISVCESSSWSGTSSYNPQSIARLLHKADLGGVIFGCKHSTISECLAKKLFGLPAPHFNYIRNIEPGLPLFLFNYSDRMLHGVYEAAGFGQLNADPYAWTESGHERTAFPAQVRIHIKIYCQPIPEKMFQPIIKENYYRTSHFYFELDHKQVKGLMLLFTPTPLSHKAGFPPRTNHLKKLSTNEGISGSMTGAAHSIKQVEGAKPKSWAELFPNDTNTSLSCKEDNIPNSKSSSNNSIEGDVKKGIVSSENDEKVKVVSVCEELNSDEEHQNSIKGYELCTTDFVQNQEDSSSDYKEHISSDDDELSQQLSEHEFIRDGLNIETERILDKLKKMASYAPVAPSGEVCRDKLHVSSTTNMTDLGELWNDGSEQESVTKNDSLHENIELMQVVKELSARTDMLERKLIENKKEVKQLRTTMKVSYKNYQKMQEQLRTTLKVSYKNYQRMQERIRELETKVDH